MLKSVQALFLPEGDLDLQARFYQGLCLLAAVVSVFVVVPANLYQGLPIVINVAAASFGALAFGLYLAARRGRFHRMTLFLALVATLNISWFPNAGSTGSVAFYFFTAVMAPVIFFQGVTRLLGVTLVVVNCLGLFWLEYWRPDLVIPFQRPADRFFDLSSGFLMSAGSCAVMLWVVLTGYHRERQRLSEARALLATMIDSTDDMAWLVDAAPYPLRAFNSAFARVVASGGMQAGVGLTPEDMAPPELARTWHDLYARAAASGPFSIELDYGARVQLVSFNPVLLEGAVGISAFAKDVTERKRMDAQMLQAQKMESLGSLAGGVAHDFNNMLSGIMGYADILLLDELDETRRQHLGAILQAATRSSDLTKKLLAFARRGKNIVEPVELKAIAGDSLAILQPTISQSVSLLSELTDSWTIDGDPSQIAQVIVNLCINANEAMPRGGMLWVRTRNATLDLETARPLGLPPGDYVELRVADTGIGMSDEVKARAFEPFFTTKVGGRVTGTGLGLSTVYGIVHLHRGAITIDSRPGDGTRFVIYLPKGTLARGPKSAAAAPAAAGQGLILIVDDEEMLRKFTEIALDRLGYATATAADGEEGVDVFRARHHELTGVILDLKMPRKNGHDAFVEMQAIDASVPILISTGYGDNEEVQGLITLGAKGLLAKPYKLTELAEQVQRLRYPPTDLIR